MSVLVQGLLASIPDPKNREGWRAVCSPLWDLLGQCRNKDTTSPTFTGTDVESAILKICTVGMVYGVLVAKLLGPPPVIRHLLRQLIHAYYSHPHYAAHSLMKGLSKVLNDKHNICSRV